MYASILVGFMAASTKSMVVANERAGTTPLAAQDHMQMAEQMPAMRGKLGNWSMAREGSGTSWMPDSSPMFMKPLGSYGGLEIDLMGSASLNFSDAGGKRGQSQFFSNSMIMLMGTKRQGENIFGLQLMTSADAVFNGKEGYPNLFQTGETAGGKPLRDRQHPHDLIAELTASYSVPVSRNARAFVYGGPVGEPALGGPMFLHRTSGMENPEAPISHHWFDATHISFGVLTGGINIGDKVQVEGSLFNGREPNENRYDIDPIRLDSGSGRVTVNPSRDLSLQVSYGYLKDPEPLDPGVSQHRLTASALYNRSLPNGDNLALTGYFGRNISKGNGTEALALESSYISGPTTLFARLERVEKDELVDVPPGTYTVNKWVLGGVRNIASRSGFDVGVGAFFGLYSFPSSLQPYYGRSPVSVGIFIRVRPSRMQLSGMQMSAGK